MSTVNDCTLEAKRLLKLIDERKLRNKEEILFVTSMYNRVNIGAEVSIKQVRWLRDIKDRQLEED